MINLYRKNETNFKHNKFVLTECKSCDITEEINSIYELNLEYISNDSKDISKELIDETFIKVPSYDDREPQLFVIRRAKPNLENGVVTCYAQSIGIAKLDNNAVLDTNIENKTRKQAVQQILSNTINPHKFIVGNKDTNLSTNNLRIVRYSALDAIKGDKDNTVLNRYGGELVLDNYTLDFVDKRGNDNGITVSYAKNITGAELTLEDIDKITELIPVGADGLLIPEKSVKASNFDINNPFTRIIEFSDIGVVEAEYDENNCCTNTNEVCTQEQAYEKLRQACLNKYNVDHVNEVSFNLTLNFIELSDCINFEGNDYSEIQNKRVAIGDTIKVNINPLNIDLKGRIYKLTRDAITGRLKSAEIGYKKANIATTINKANKEIDNTKKKVDDTKAELKDDIADANEKTSNLKVVMEKKDSEIELSVTNESEARAAAILVQDGKIDERVKSTDFESYQTITDREIADRVSKGTGFYAEMLMHPDAIVNLIHGITDNKTTLNSNGFTITGGGFVFENNNGDKLIQAIPSGGIRLGDSDWSANTTEDMICLGGTPLSQYFMLSKIYINSDLDMGMSPSRYDIKNVENIYAQYIETADDAAINGTLTCGRLECNDKHGAVDTNDYGRILINAYETAEYYFGDLGEGNSGETGIIYIAFDPKFLECVNTNISYHCFTQVYNGKSAITNLERYPNHCILKCEPNTEFSWEIKAKAIGKEDYRLEKSKIMK